MTSPRAAPRSTSSYDLVEGRPLLPDGDPIEAPGDDTVSVSRRTRERQTA